MTEKSECGQTAEQIILPLPNASELSELRKEYGQIKLAIPTAGSRWGNTKIGEYTVAGTKKAVTVTWKTIDGPERTENFEELSIKAELSGSRLELGWMIANMLRVEAVRVLQAIPGPKEAQDHWNFYKKEEQRWRKWATMEI